MVNSCRLPVTLLMWVVLGMLPGCARLQTTPVPADLPMDSAAGTARLTEDDDHPLILRGVDRQPVPFRVYMPALVTHHYLLAPGKHLLWVQSLAGVLYPFPIPLGDIHCYALEAELTAGKTYRLKELLPRREAVVIEEAGAGQIVAQGALMDSFPAGIRTCAWPQGGTRH